MRYPNQGWSHHLWRNCAGNEDRARHEGRYAGHKDRAGHEGQEDHEQKVLANRAGTWVGKIGFPLQRSRWVERFFTIRFSFESSSSAHLAELRS